MVMPQLLVSCRIEIIAEMKGNNILLPDPASCVYVKEEATC